MQILIGGVFWRRRTLDPLLLLLLRIGITTVLLIGIINTNRTIVMGGCPLYSNPNQAEWVKCKCKSRIKVAKGVVIKTAVGAVAITS